MMDLLVLWRSGSRVGTLFLMSVLLSGPACSIRDQHQSGKVELDTPVSVCAERWQEVLADVRSVRVGPDERGKDCPLSEAQVRQLVQYLTLYRAYEVPPATRPSELPPDLYYAPQLPRLDYGLQIRTVSGGEVLWYLSKEKGAVWADGRLLVCEPKTGQRVVEIVESALGIEGPDKGSKANSIKTAKYSMITCS